MPSQSAAAVNPRIGARSAARYVAVGAPSSARRHGGLVYASALGPDVLFWACSDGMVHIAGTNACGDAVSDLAVEPHLDAHVRSGRLAGEAHRIGQQLVGARHRLEAFGRPIVAGVVVGVVGVLDGLGRGPRSMPRTSQGSFVMSSGFRSTTRAGLAVRCRAPGQRTRSSASPSFGRPAGKRFRIKAARRVLHTTRSAP